MLIEHIVLSGGGVKGIALLGALKALDDHDLLTNVKTYVGSSVGALLGALMCVGYSPEELYNVMSSINPYEFKSIEPMKLLTHFGIDSGEKIVKFLCTMIRIKTGNQNITFQELFDKCGMTLIVTGTCIESGQVKYFSRHSTPNVGICNAVRLSISIPFLFSAVRYRGRTYVDGGLLNNFPIDALNDQENVLGIRLSSSDCKDDDGSDTRPVSSLEQFAIGLVTCVIDEIQKLRFQNSSHREDVIFIDTGDISAIQFDLSAERRRELFDLGQAAVDGYLMKNETKDEES
jgi:NTE family protein